MAIQMQFGRANIFVPGYYGWDPYHKYPPQYRDLVKFLHKLKVTKLP